MSKLAPYPIFAFHALESKLNKVKRAFTLSDVKNKLGWGSEEEDGESSPLFITWNILDRNNVNQLRGCIGTFSPLPLEQGVTNYSLIAAFDDPRFSAISKAELPRLSVSVTLLQHFEEVDDPLDWELGTHGIRISFYKHGKSYGATFLPDVATEQGWDKEETLTHLVAKAGYHMGKIDLGEIKVTRYQGLKTKATYEEYRDFMKSIE